MQLITSLYVGVVKRIYKSGGAQSRHCSKIGLLSARCRTLEIALLNTISSSAAGDPMCMKVLRSIGLTQRESPECRVLPSARMRHSRPFDLNRFAKSARKLLMSSNRFRRRIEVERYPRHRSVLIAYSNNLPSAHLGLGLMNF
jgi:hypothetical protein